MKKPELKEALSAALSKSETTDPAEVLKLLMDASKQGDAALGAAVRQSFTVIGFSLLAISWEVESKRRRRSRGSRHGLACLCRCAGTETGLQSRLRACVGR
jgi:hypothetical protein